MNKCINDIKRANPGTDGFKHSHRWQNGQADLGHALVAFDVMANTLSHPRVDVAHFWTTRWRFGGFSPSNNQGSVADALQVSCIDSD